jgi:hypothetical protein
MHESSLDPCPEHQAEAHLNSRLLEVRSKMANFVRTLKDVDGPFCSLRCDSSSSDVRTALPVGSTRRSHTQGLFASDENKPPVNQRYWSLALVAFLQFGFGRDPYASDRQSTQGHKFQWSDPTISHFRI